MYTRKIVDFLDDEGYTEYEDLLYDKKDSSSTVKVNIKNSEPKPKIKEETEEKKEETITNSKLEEVVQEDIKKNNVQEEIQGYEIVDKEIEDESQNNENEEPLDELSRLLKELDELDQMLKATSIEIKNEKEKKQHNKKIREKMRKVNNMMQDTKGER